MNRDPVRWDTYSPSAPDLQPEKPKPSREQQVWGAKNAPGPTLPECDECGSEANPSWSDGTCTFCRSCVPADLRYPTGTKL